MLLVEMGWKPKPMPKDKRTREWALWMRAMRMHKARKSPRNPPGRWGKRNTDTRETPAVELTHTTLPLDRDEGDGTGLS